MEQDRRLERISGQERFERMHRLRSSLDFQRVRQYGRHISGTYLALTYLRQAASGTSSPMDGAGATRIGFSVSKRVGNAVTRNVVKRRLRESARRHLRELAPAWDIVITARSTAAQAEYHVLDAELIRLLTRAGLRKTLERSETRVYAD